MDLLSATESLQPLVKKILRAARSDAPILIGGESGTGKELVARAIHEESARSSGPFVCLNLAAVPTELAETVLFGHEQGAFTGAMHQVRGYCRMAADGTLFLDEIGEADLLLQAKLLRFLERHEVQPVGSETIITVNVRIVTATNRDLEQAVREKQFREDLFYRLNIVRLQIPPLRDRRDDIDFLVDFFLREFNSKYKRQCLISMAARDLFRIYDWPGNIRQLRGAIESLVVLSEYDTIGIHDLSCGILTHLGEQPSASTPSQPADKLPELERLTHHLVLDVLEQTEGNVTHAAHRLGIGRATLYRWLKNYRLSNSSNRPRQIPKRVGDHFKGRPATGQCDTDHSNGER